jgi:hypothetical protein
MERFGTAWEKIETKIANGYPEPSFDGDGPVFTATIWPYPLVVGSHAPLRRQSGGVDALGSGNRLAETG